MKITVKPRKEEKNKNVPFDKIPVGYVYVSEFSDGAITLKLKNNEAVLLSHFRDEDWFEIADGFKGKPAYKVLGKLMEIIVEEE